MSAPTLHVISLTVPWPPDFGGAIDIWYKLVALHRAGVRIELHCFLYDRPKAAEIEKVCDRVHYYLRPRKVGRMASAKPFIVATRDHPDLLRNLQSTPGPILMEGVHSTRFLNHPLLRERDFWIRTHNVEHEYYRALSLTETRAAKRLYYLLEAFKLERYESSILKNARGILTISESDHKYFAARFPNCHIIPPFHGNDRVSSKTGKGRYVLYHGDLSVPENISSARRLIALSDRFSLPLVLAGRIAEEARHGLIDGATEIRFVQNPSRAVMDELISDAAAILLPATQTTGFRLKLLDSLYKGRHVIAEPNMVHGTGLDALCTVVHNEDQWIEAVDRLGNAPFTEEMRSERTRLLQPHDDRIKAEKIKSLIFHGRG